MFPSQSGKKKKRNQTRSKRVIILVAVLAVVAAAVAAYFVFFHDATPGIGDTTLRTPVDAEMIPTADSLYYLKDGKLTSVDYSDNEKWTMALEGNDQQFCASNTLVALYNTTHLSLYSYDGSTLFGSKKFHGTILDVHCGETLVTVLNEDSAGTMHITTLDRDGNEVGQGASYDGRYVLNFGFTSGDSSFSYTVDTGSVSPVSRITTQNEQLANTGNVTIEGQVLQHIIFRPEAIYAIGTNHVFEVDYLGVTQSEHLIYGWNYCDSSVTKEGKVAILFAPGGEASGESYMPTARLHIPGSSDVFIQLSAGTKKLLMGTDRIYAFTAKTLTTYSLSGDKMAEYPLEIEAQEITAVPGDGKRVLLQNDEGIVVGKLP